MEFTASQIAEILSGKIVGDSEATVSTFAKIEEGHAKALSFLANAKYNEFIYECKSSVVIVGTDFEAEKEVSATLIVVERPYESFALLLRKYQELKSYKVGIEQPSYISESSVLGEGVYVGAFSKIGNNTKIGNNVRIHSNVSIGDNVVIGNNSEIFSGAVVYEECLIGNECIIHSGTVVGCDGFGFAPNANNEYEKIPQIGNVILEDKVEIGSNCTLDRATMGSTIIRKGVKLDNLVHIAHNVEIGENTVIAAQSGIAGSAKLGKNCMLGGQVGIAGHLVIADGTKIAAQSGIGHNIKKEGTIVQGSPAFDIMPYKKSYVGFRKLPELLRKVDG